MTEYRVQYDFAAAGLVHSTWTPSFRTMAEAEAAMAALLDPARAVETTISHDVELVVDPLGDRLGPARLDLHPFDAHVSAARVYAFECASDPVQEDQP